MKQGKNRLLIGILTLVAVLCTQLAVPQPVEARSKKILYTTSSKNITLTAGRNKSVMIVYKQTGTVSIKSSNTNIADAKWSDSDWKNDKTKLKIIGVAPGTANITITATKTKQKIRFKVKVKKGSYYARLNNFINNNGDELNGGGYSYVKNTDSVSDEDTKFSFQLDNNTDGYINLSEWMFTKDSDGEDLSVGLIMYMNNKLEVPTLMIDVTGDGVSYTAQISDFDTAGYMPGKTVNFSITDKDTILSNSDLRKNANELLSQNLQLLDTDLQLDVGFGLHELGFLGF